MQIGRQYFKQSIGISQGSVLSTLLCNIYYGQMERTFMPPQDDELLMRMVDDSLFVTPSRERAELFLCKMIKGILNVFINEFLSNTKCISMMHSLTSISWMPDTMLCFDQGIRSTIFPSTQTKFQSTLIISMKLVE